MSDLINSGISNFLVPHWATSYVDLKMKDVQCNSVHCLTLLVYAVQEKKEK